MKSLIKYIFMLMVIAMGVVSFASCGGGNDDGGDYGDSSFDISQIYGTWTCTSSSSSKNGKSYTDLDKGKTMTIKSDGTYLSTSSYIGNSGDWINDGNKIVARNSNNVTINITVSVSGNTMMWIGETSEGYSITYRFTR